MTLPHPAPTPEVRDPSSRLLRGDALGCLRTLPDTSVDSCVTSPPYYRKRRYGTDPVHWPAVRFRPAPDLPEIEVPEEHCELGWERTSWSYVAHLLLILREVRRVLGPGRVLLLNLGDTYGRDASTKQLLGMPWKVAFALQADGWTLRMDLIWHKSSGRPERVDDRCTTAHETIFHFSTGPSYYWDAQAIGTPGRGRAVPDHPPVSGLEDTAPPERTQYRRARELAAHAGLQQRHLDALRAVGLSSGKRGEGQSGAGHNSAGTTALADEARRVLGSYSREFVGKGVANRRSVWSFRPGQNQAEHPGVMNLALARDLVVACTPPGGLCLDPFAGTGTTGRAATELGRQFIGIELHPQTTTLAERNLKQSQPGLPLIGKPDRRS